MPGPDEALMSALGDALVEQELATRAFIAKTVGDLVAAIPDEIDARLADRPIAKDGEPGQDGVDRVLTLPRYIGPNDTFERNEVAAFKGGIWQAVRAGRGDPEADPFAWRCLVPGVATIEVVEDWAKRELNFGFRMSDGTLNVTRARMMPGLLPPDYAQRGFGIIAGDIIRDGDFDRIAQVDGADPAKPTDWEAREVRGRRGRPGETTKGEPGPAGPGLTGLSLATDKSTGRLAIVPAFADPAVKGDPILVDMMTGDLAPGRRAIVGFAGRHDQGKSYGRGDVVSASGGALWLSLKPDNRAALVEGARWERMV
jgi:hypothetical protein